VVREVEKSGHDEHFVAPEELEYSPIEQAVHDVEFTVFE
jgi:hypothetical protein